MTQPLPQPRKPPHFQLADAEGTPSLSGIRGWLLFFAFTQVVGLLVIVYQLRDVSLRFSPASWALGDRVHFYRPTIIIETVARLGFLAAGATGLLLMWRRASYTRAFYCVLLGFGALFGLFQAIVVAGLYPQFVALARQAGNNGVALAIEQSDQTWAGFRTLGVSTAWLAYWLFSERVARTFSPPVESLSGA